MEFQKWAPAVRTVILKGSPAQRKDQYHQIRTLDFQVCLTTYEYIIKERPLLSKIKWIHMIIDEGHRMKNVKSKLSQTLNEYYSTRYRLILTGTPLQVSPGSPFPLHFVEQEDDQLIRSLEQLTRALGSAQFRPPEDLQLCQIVRRMVQRPVRQYRW
jgi:hypothetical protein